MGVTLESIPTPKNVQIPQILIFFARHTKGKEFVTPIIMPKGTVRKLATIAMFAWITMEERNAKIYYMMEDAVRKK